MKIDLLSASTVGIAGLITAGLLALPVTATAAGDDGNAKRDEDTPDVVLVNDDDDDDDTGLKAGRVDSSNTGFDRDTRSRDTRSRNSRTNSRTGANSGRDNSRANNKLDWTKDGAGQDRRDWSVNKTNDRSRNNTSR